MRPKPRTGNSVSTALKERTSHSNDIALPPRPNREEGDSLAQCRTATGHAHCIVHANGSQH
jgi:hypothetical protein